MRKLFAFLYFLLITFAAIFSFVFLDRQISMAENRAFELEKLGRAFVRIESLAGWSMNIKEFEKNSSEAKTAAEMQKALKADSPQLANRVQRIFDDFFFRFETHKESAIKIFREELFLVMDDTYSLLELRRSEFKDSAIQNISFAAVVGFVILFLVWTLRFVSEKRENKKRLEIIKAQIDSLSRYITNRSNEFVGVTSDDSLLSSILAEIDLAASEYDKHREANIRTLGEMLIISDQVGKGHLSHKILGTSEDYLNHGLIKVFNQMAESINASIFAVLEVLRQYQSGDYTKSITLDKQEGQIRELIDGVNTLGKVLNESAKMNHKNGLTLNSSAKELTNTVESLSEVASSQNRLVSHITKASLDIAKNIKETTEKSNQMSKIAIETKEAAVNGLIYSSDTVDAMKQIQHSAKEIRDAIAVIDSIAFQTNILSLNAAVEAATAGEAGKGFAVVASEVRNLANKSAEAAKKIKELVEETENKSNEGMAISDSMIRGFEDLAQKITSTYNLVNEVAEASQDEMKKAEAIEGAIRELLKVNAQNSKVATHTKSVAIEVSELASRLQDAAKTKSFDG